MVLKSVPASCAAQLLQKRIRTKNSTSNMVNPILCTLTLWYVEISSRAVGTMPSHVEKGAKNPTTIMVESAI